MDNYLALSLDDHLLVLSGNADMKFKIIHAIDEPLDKMTVERICENCGIARSTFYHHFNSKYDIQPWFIQTGMQNTIDHVGKTKTWEQGVTAFLRYLELENRFNQFAVQKWTPHSALKEHRKQVIMQTLEERCPSVVDEGMKVLISHYVDSEGQLYVKWFKRQIDLPPDELPLLFVSCIPKRLYDAMSEAFRQTPLMRFSSITEPRKVRACP